MLRSTPKAPKTGFVAAAGTAGAALPAGADDPPRQPLAIIAATTAAPHAHRFFDTPLPSLIGPSRLFRTQSVVSTSRLGPEMGWEPGARTDVSAYLSSFM